MILKNYCPLICGKRFSFDSSLQVSNYKRTFIHCLHLSSVNATSRNCASLELCWGSSNRIKPSRCSKLQRYTKFQRIHFWSLDKKKTILSSKLHSFPSADLGARNARSIDSPKWPQQPKKLQKSCRCDGSGKKPRPSLIVLIGKRGTHWNQSATDSTNISLRKCVQINMYMTYTSISCLHMMPLY